MEQEYDPRKSFYEFSEGEIRSGLESVRSAMVLGEIPARRFDMQTVCRNSSIDDCGTIMCLGGWLGTSLRMSPRHIQQVVCEIDNPDYASSDPHSLRALFWNFPEIDENPDYPPLVARERLLPFEGIEALNAWLKGNKSDPWETVRTRIQEAACDPDVLKELRRLEKLPLTEFMKEQSNG